MEPLSNKTCHTILVDLFAFVRMAITTMRKAVSIITLLVCGLCSVTILIGNMLQCKYVFEKGLALLAFMLI